MTKPAEPVDRAWRDLRRHLQRAPDAPFVAYAFADDSEPVQRLVQRLAVVLRARGVLLRHLKPETPGELLAVLGSMFTTPGAVVVLDAVHADREGSAAWSDAWATVAARLNAGRAQVQTELRGLLLAMPTSAWHRVRAAAPDLWSIRDVLCELGAAPRADAPSLPEPRGMEPIRAMPSQAALAAAEALEAREGHTEGWARGMVDALPGFVARGDVPRAVRLGQEAIRVLPRTDANWPALVAAVADAESASGDDASAIAHWREAAAAAGQFDRRALRWLGDAGKRLLDLRFVTDADQVAGQALARARGRVEASADGSTLRDLSVALDHVGKVAEARGRWDDASALYAEALAVCRRLAAEVGETPEALRDLSISLDSVGRVAEARGRWDDAAVLYGEALALRRRLAAEIGETPQAQRDLFVSLNNVGDVAVARGLWDDAAALYGESLGVCRRLAIDVGGTPEALRDLSVSLNTVGKVAEARGRWDDAAALYGESLAVRRRLAAEVGETPEVLRDLSVSLDNVGRVAVARGRWDDAAALYRESLAVRRRLAAEVGETPEVLRDLSVSLNHVGSVAEARGRWDDAATLYGEALAVCRRLAGEIGETPEALRDLSVSLDNVGGVAVARGRWDDAAALYGESLAVCRRLAAEIGETPGALRDLFVSLDNVGRVAEAGDRWDDATAAYGESLALCRRLAAEIGETPEVLRDLCTALLHLARVIAKSDPERARALAREAEARLATIPEGALAADHENLRQRARLLARGSDPTS